MKRNTAAKLYLMVLCFATSSLLGYGGNRDFPFYNAIEPKCQGKAIGLKIAPFWTKSLPVIESNIGDRVQNPWLQYNLRDLSASLQEYQTNHGMAPVNYFLGKEQVNYIPDGTPILYDMRVEREAVGAALQTSYVFANILDHHKFPGDFGRRYNDKLGSIDLFLQFNFAVMSAKSRGHYSVNPETRSQMITSSNTGVYTVINPNDLLSQLTSVDVAMRKDLRELGLLSAYSDQSGLCDLDFVFGLRKNMDYTLRCRRLSYAFGLTGSIPLAKQADPNQALSFNFGNNDSRLGFFAKFEAELKHGLLASCEFRKNVGSTNTVKGRLPLDKEPMILSPFVGQYQIEHGGSFIFSPRLQLSAFKKNVDLEVAFVYISHDQDHYLDTIDHTALGTFINRPNMTAYNRDRMMGFTEWSAKFITAEFTLHPQAFKDSEYPPTFFAKYEHPLHSKNTIRNRRITFGTQITF